MVKTIEVFSGRVEGRERFLVFFRYDHEVITLVKSIAGARWEHYGRYWHIAATEANIGRLRKTFGSREGYSVSYQNQFISAYKILVQDVLRKGEPVVSGIKRPKTGLRLPNVLNKDEVKRLLRVTRNGKHRVMLGITYACGLRCGETLSLKLGDIDSKRGLVRVNQGKGGRDRVVPIPGALVAELREYYCDCRPRVWLFEGVKPGFPYSRRSFEEVLKKSVKLAGIKKSVTLHWLRHSYATHLHESGVDIRYIQLLLGHKSTKTTEIYTHVSQRDLLQIRSPFEDL